MVLSEMETDIHASPSVINRHRKINENNSCSTFAAAVSLHTSLPIYIQIHGWQTASAFM
jgi:hypothetical protein